jgi:hypothetical protein
LFKSNWTDVAERRTPNAIIVALNNLENNLSGLGMCLEAHQVNAFAFERSKGRLGDGIIPTVALAAHAHCRQKRLISRAGILASPIGVMQKFSLRAPLEQSQLLGKVTGVSAESVARNL